MRNLRNKYREEIMEEAHEKAIGMQNLFITEAEQMLNQFTTQRNGMGFINYYSLDLLLKNDSISKLIRIIINQEVIIEENRKELDRLIRQNPFILGDNLRQIRSKYINQK